MGGYSPGIRIADAFLAALASLDGEQHLGRHLAAAVEPTGCAQPTEWAQAFLDGSFVSAKKGGPTSGGRRSARARKS
jgi:hypothetical protein